jgi:hypothetical protein
MAPDPSRRTACPECGQEFTTRGLAAHRRQRHGTGVQAPLPAQAPVSAATVKDILSALQLLRGAVERIDEHIRTAEAYAAQKETPDEEARRLEHELALLLEQIVRIHHLAAAGGVDVTIAPMSDEIARMRREQARLVFRLDELKQGTPNEERFLT